GTPRNVRRGTRPRRMQGPGSWCPWRRRAPGCVRGRPRAGRYAWETRVRTSGSFLRAVRTDAEQMADREHEIGAVHGVEMEGIDAMLGELLHLARGNGGRDQLAGFGIVVEALEFLGEPVRHGRAGAGQEGAGRPEIVT